MEAHHFNPKLKQMHSIYVPDFLYGVCWAQVTVFRWLRITRVTISPFVEHRGMALEQSRLKGPRLGFSEPSLPFAVSSRPSGITCYTVDKPVSSQLGFLQVGLGLRTNLNPNQDQQAQEKGLPSSAWGQHLQFRACIHRHLFYAYWFLLLISRFSTLLSHLCPLAQGLWAKWGGYHCSAF